jgi:hypothetical protein
VNLILCGYRRADGMRETLNEERIAVFPLGKEIKIRQGLNLLYLRESYGLLREQIW